MIHCITSEGNIIECDGIEWFLQTNNYMVWAQYKNTINENGSWAQIEIHTNELKSDSDQSYYAGLIEGYLTENLITNHYNNKLSDYFTKEEEFALKLKNFIKVNIDFMIAKINKYRESDPYWHCVALILEQITGLQDGYEYKSKNIKPKGPRIEIKEFDEIFLLNLMPDLDVLEEVLNKKFIDRLIGEGSCSAIVKPLQDGSDLLVAHNMWSTYHSMLRIIKKYEFRFHLLPNVNPRETNLIAGYCMSFSSYPGTVLSLDDFYILSSGLVVQETTFEILNNQTLWECVKPMDKVFEFIRVLVANRLSKSGHEWTQIFGKYNSGTYNSQFMVVDYKLFHKELKPQQLPNNLLWICEQLPDYIRSEDMTTILRKHEYWASYNIPYFQDIYTNGGYNELKQKYGNYFSYENTPRAQIFRRDHKYVNDLNSLMLLMRSNDYLNDPLSQYDNCLPKFSADLAISARNDLNDPNGVYAIPVLGFRARGAIDAKITSNDLLPKYSMYAVSGPTHQSLPPFEWSKLNITKIKHVGQPDKWEFSPVYIEWLS